MYIVIDVFISLQCSINMHLYECIALYEARKINLQEHYVKA